MVSTRTLRMLLVLGCGVAGLILLLGILADALSDRADSRRDASGRS